MVCISIIMPLYNAAKYLGETLNSVRRQTFTDFELICINDASTDDTMKILCDFQTKDSRIQILSNPERHGAAYSRNRGMKAAKGEYLAFLDGDDIYEEEMYEMAYQAASEQHADVVMYEYRHVASDSIYNKLKVFHSQQYVEKYCKKLFSIQNYAPYEYLNWGLGPWNKLYKREYIEQNRLIFQDLSCSNDTYFVCMALMLSEKLLLLHDDRVMVYVRDHDEPTRISVDRDPMCCYQAFLHIAEELDNRGKFSELCMHFYYHFFSDIRNALLQCRREEKRRTFYYFLKEKGIDAIMSVDGGHYDEMDDYIKDQVEQFKTKDYDEKWFEEEPGLQIPLSWKQHTETVIKIFTKYRELNKTVGIWGAGANGISLLNFCQKHNLCVNMIVDKANEKQGCRVNGLVIRKPEEINGNLQVVIVATRNIFKSVERELAGQDIEVIDMNQVLWVY